MPLFVSGQYLQDSVARRTDYTKRRIPETSPARAVLDIGVHWADTASFVMGCPIKKYMQKCIRIILYGWILLQKKR